VAGAALLAGSYVAHIMIKDDSPAAFSDVPPTPVAQIVAEAPATLGAFERGEFHFNVDGNSPQAYDLEKARLAFEEAVAVNPRGHNLLWFQLGRVYFLQGRPDAALRAFERQREFFGDTVVAVYYAEGLVYAYKAHRSNSEHYWERAVSSFQRFIELQPHSPWARVNLAWVYFSRGMFEEMLPPLEEGLRFFPEQPWLLNLYGLALLNTGKPEEAVETFKTARAAAAALTVEDWGRAHPGNDPRQWERGLLEFRFAIDNNLFSAKEKATVGGSGGS
jgi:tetratricopeptide (TPR) repeat protein